MATMPSELLSLPTDRPLVMGVLNTTPDSFSDGGKWGTVERAVARAEHMLQQGADIIDVGGESSRPGALPVDVDEELRRVIPVIERLAGRCPISIDTVKPRVAEAAVAKGACIVNDISSSLENVAADIGAGWVAMHMQGQPQNMQNAPHYSEVVAEVLEQLAISVERAQDAGVERVWVDPGIGFGKTTDHNLALLNQIGAFVKLAPVVVGVSRKRSIGEIHGLADDMLGPAAPAGVDDRLEGSVAAAVWAWSRGANIVRTHDVYATALAARSLS